MALYGPLCKWLLEARLLWMHLTSLVAAPSATHRDAVDDADDAIGVVGLVLLLRATDLLQAQLLLHRVVVAQCGRDPRIVVNAARRNPSA